MFKPLTKDINTSNVKSTMFINFEVRNLEAKETLPKFIEPKTNALDEVSSFEGLKLVKTPGVPANGYKVVQLKESLGNADFDKNILNSLGSLNGGSTFKIGDNQIRVNQGYVVRKNTGQHSTGMDLAINGGHVISFSDGVIVDANIQGTKDPVLAFQRRADGSVIKAAGQYITVKHSDGSMIQYMHLDPLSDDEMKSMIGRKVKRGDTLGGYFKGSGTMTGAHLKVVYKVGGKHADPTNIMLYGKK